MNQQTPCKFRHLSYLGSRRKLTDCLVDPQYTPQTLTYGYPASALPYNQHPTANFHQYTGRATNSPSTVATASNHVPQQQTQSRISASSSPHALHQRALQHSPPNLIPQASSSHHLQHHAHLSPQVQQLQPVQQQPQHYIRPFLPPAPQPSRPNTQRSRGVVQPPVNSVAAPSLNVPGSRSLPKPIEVTSDSPVHQSSALVLNPTERPQPSKTSITARSTIVPDEDPEDPEDDNAEDSGAVFQIPAPPENKYVNETALERAIHAWSLQHGYELVRRASKKNAAGTLYKRYYHCSKHGKIANTGKLTDRTRVRTNRKSNRMGCPMSIAAVAIDPSAPEGEWEIRHRKVHHNHGPMEAVTMAGHRRRARMGDVEKAVDGLFAINTTTTQVLQFLRRTNPTGLFTRTDVANMKLKYKKYGTCVKDEDTSRNVSGVPSACLSCRARKQRCDSARPACSSCMTSNTDCKYDHEPQPIQHVSPPTSPGHPDPLVQSLNFGGQSEQQQASPNVVANKQSAEQILANLQSFQTEHIRPVKLSLQSSSVEVIAQSSSGNGESYANLPTLRAPADWIKYRDSMVQAALRENTYDVLDGLKVEPERPNEEHSVEEWNEYIKQLAIFNRRNSALLGAIWSTIGISFRSRVSGLRDAHAVWQTLEEMCLPRGSDQAFRLYLELTDISLQNSANLRDYIGRLEAAHTQLVRLKVANNDKNLSKSLSNLHSATNSLRPAESIFPEEQLCLFFMRNLGAEWRGWVDNLCASNNVAGFGTGPKINFHDVSRRAIEHQALHVRSIHGQLR